MFVALLSLLFAHAIVHGYIYKEKGDSCRKVNGRPGICIHFSDCPFAIEEVKYGYHPEICSFAGLFPIVCCLDVTYPFENLELEDRVANGNDSITPITPGQDLPIDVRDGSASSIVENLPFDETNLSLRKCRDYQAVKQNNSGDSSETHQYSHMALLGYVEESNAIRWKCVGSLISERFVLTTARCAKPQRFGKLKYVQLGQMDINSDTDNAKPQDFTVNNTYVHPDFEYVSTYNDVGLVELNKPVKFTNTVNPACLATNQSLDGSLLEAVGYGLLGQQEKLGMNRMMYSSSDSCKEIYPPNSINGVPDDQLVCTQSISDEDSTCYVDIGGPLQLINSRYQFGNFSEIVGIYLFGSSCEASGDIFVNILPFVSWIEKIVWPDS